MEITITNANYEPVAKSSSTSVLMGNTVIIEPQWYDMDGELPISITIVSIPPPELGIFTTNSNVTVFPGLEVTSFSPSG